MRFRAKLVLPALALALLSAMAWADQIVLKDGTAYSGKFIRGDSSTIDFQVLGRIETFNTANISQISFKPVEPSTVGRPATVAKPAVDATSAKTTPQVVKRAEPQLAQKPKVQAIQTVEQTEAYAPSTITLPVGTPIVVRTTAEIDTDRNRVGDVFEATLDEALMFNDRTVAPRHSTVKGRIAYAKESGKLTGQSQLVLELTDLLIDGKSYLLRTSDYTEVGASRGNRTAATVGGTAALGAIIGAIAGGGKGAAIGAASGAAVGTGVQVVTKGQTLKIPAETILEFRLQSPLAVEVP